MHKFRNTLSLFLLLITGTPFAATEFDGDVPVEIVRQMVSGDIYADLPEDFPELEIPADLVVSGSVRSDYSSLAIFTTTLSAGDGSMALASSLNRAGWLQLPQIEYQPPQNGFIRPDAELQDFSRNLDYCHDQYGTLSINPGNENNGTTSISARLNNIALRQPGFSCQQQIEQRNFSAERRGGFPFFNPNSQYIPRLVLPEEGNQPSPMIARVVDGAFSSSGGETETNAALRGEWNPGELLEHFTGQLEVQGWVLDSDWSGEFTAGSNWAYSPQPDLNFIGVLSIIESIEGVFTLKFRLIPRTLNPSGASIQGVNIIRKIALP
jgi:hypothetical protein